MHTRYAPVRHSPRPEGRFPFDLHVLGLPPAFILSQDQTLRCTIALALSFLCISGPACLCLTSKPTPRGSRHSARLCWPQAVIELPAPGIPTQSPPLSPKAGAKVQPFSEPASVFFKYFSFLSQWVDSQLENFSSKARKRGGWHLY